MSQALSFIDSEINELKAPFVPSTLGFISSPTTHAASFVVKYLEDDLQSILKTVLEGKTLAPIALLEGLQEKLLKTRFLNIYQGKTHIKYYNYCQQYENHFAIARTKKLNCNLFVASFFWNQVVFC